jgi:alkanesulfonate monooxygenase SsuD/methylene tetrahydromethanopterin reductase-like flavin-dependent oxidoreductase (luciferase family)
MMPEVNQYRASFEQHHGAKPPPIIIADMVACFNDAQKSKDYARQYQGAYFRSVLDHYEMLGNHFQSIPSYANYANAAHAMQTEGVDKAFEDYLTSNLHGTPEEIVEKIQKRAEIVGDHDLSVNFTYGSMPYEDVWEQAKTFADKVLPYIK